MKSIVLIGMMGSGKSTCARQLSKTLGRELVDTDAQIVARAGKAIADVFAQDGEQAFRDWETAICCELSGRDDLVIATGGGLILRQENVQMLRKSGVLVFLNRSPELTFKTTSMDGRPLAQSGKAQFLETYAVRLPFYRAAAALEICDFSSVPKTVTEMLRKLKNMEGIL